ncbi:patatin-like phospholipase family protein [candidate division WOR-3 bacterium]|nr:patatin-like phospholipase family protein [candidate division WOR-3 bacterium]
MKIGLALGGGASHGLAHIGVLQVLEEAKIPIHLICGTSIGAVIGGLYALNPDARLLEKIAREIITSEEFKTIGFDLFENPRVPKPFRNLADFIKEHYIYIKEFINPYIVKGEKLYSIFNRLFGTALISQTKIQFASVAVDLKTGEDRIIRDGPIIDAVRSSSAIPGVFPYITDFGSILVDGGITSTVPTKAVRELGANFIIASSLMRKLNEPASLRTGFQINLRVDEIVKYRLNKLNLLDVDLIISPEVHKVHWSDFSKLAFCIKKGRDAALKSLPELKRQLSLFGRLKRWFKHSV